MSIILEELQSRLADAQKVFADATQKFQLAQQALQKAQNDVNVWTAAVAIEVREEQAKAATANENQLPMDLPVAKPQIVPVVESSQNSASTGTVNKTEIVRDLLAKHPGGMTPADLWREVNTHFAHRPYLYSVLKRLKDRDEVTVRRNKYALKPKPEEVKEHADLLQ